MIPSRLVEALSVGLNADEVAENSHIAGIQVNTGISAFRTVVCAEDRQPSDDAPLRTSIENQCGIAHSPLGTKICNHDHRVRADCRRIC